MLWPFNHFRKPQTPLRGTIEAIYGMIVTQAREPLFYRDLAVPDTVNGRFEMVVLHLALLLWRLEVDPAEAAKRVSQGLFDRFCVDMDGNLREMGVGDLKVPKEMKLMGEAFFGRVAAYRTALAESSDDKLTAAVARNVFEGEGAGAPRLAAYMRRTAAVLEEQKDILAGRPEWTAPERVLVAEQA